MPEYTPYQQGIIKRYYDSRDNVNHQKITELISDLHLSEGKKRKSVWKRIKSVLLKLNVAQEKIDELTKTDDSVILAEFVKKELKS